MNYKPRLRRKEVPQYLADKFGISISASTLAKLAMYGGSPKMEYYGRSPLYKLEDLDAWAASKLSPPVNTTAERQR